MKDYTNKIDKPISCYKIKKVNTFRKRKITNYNNWL